MRTFRTLLLLASLAVSFEATAQSAPLPAANQDMLSWMLNGLLGAVGLILALAAIVMIMVATARTDQRPAVPGSPAAPSRPLPATPALVPQEELAL